MTEFEEQVAVKICKAIETINSGICKRVDIDSNTKVYAVKDIIRIDIKQEVK